PAGLPCGEDYNCRTPWIAAPASSQLSQGGELAMKTGRSTSPHPTSIALGGPGNAPGRDRGHQGRDQGVVAGERNTKEAPLHHVAGDDLHLVELIEQVAGLAEIDQRSGAIGRPLPELPFDAGVIAAEDGIAGGGQRDDDEPTDQEAPWSTLRCAQGDQA